jgi:mycofactocin precursor
MEPTALTRPQPGAPRALAPLPPAASPAVPAEAQTEAQTAARADSPPQTPPAAPRLDLSRLEPPRRLAEARLEEVTIDGICGVY